MHRRPFSILQIYRLNFNSNFSRLCKPHLYLCAVHDVYLYLRIKSCCILMQVSPYLPISTSLALGELILSSKYRSVSNYIYTIFNRCRYRKKIVFYFLYDMHDCMHTIIDDYYTYYVVYVL